VSQKHQDIFELYIL